MSVFPLVQALRRHARVRSCVRASFACRRGPERPRAPFLRHRIPRSRVRARVHGNECFPSFRRFDATPGFAAASSRPSLVAIAEGAPAMGRRWSPLPSPRAAARATARVGGDQLVPLQALRWDAVKIRGGQPRPHESFYALQLTSPSLHRKLPGGTQRRVQRARLARSSSRGTVSGRLAGFASAVSGRGSPRGDHASRARPNHRFGNTPSGGRFDATFLPASEPHPPPTATAAALGPSSPTVKSATPLHRRASLHKAADAPLQQAGPLLRDAERRRGRQPLRCLHPCLQ